MEKKTVYFEKPGEQNTDETLKLAAAEARAHGLDTLVLASNRGYTAARAMALCSGFKLIVVGGYRSQFDTKRLAELEKAGHKVVFVYDDALKYEYSPQQQTRYRKIAGEGGKVCPEVIVAAVTAGLIPEGILTVGIGGTYPGADTAFVIKSARDFEHIQVEKIICQPRKS